MKIRSITCPSCGGTLNIENVNQSLLYCQYCGTAIQLETNRNKGYDMEHGRMDARAEMADKILGSIESIKDVLIRNSNADKEMKYYPHAIAECRDDLRASILSDIKDSIFKKFLKGLVVLFVGALFIVCVGGMLNIFLLGLLELIVLLAPIYLPVIGGVRMVKEWIGKKNQISLYETRLKEVKKEYEETSEFIKKNAEVDIPPRFRFEPALNYIIKGLKAREFVSLEQALFRCEEAMARGEVLDRYDEF